MELEKYLTPEVIYLDIAGQDKAGILRDMVARLCRARGLSDVPAILQSVYDREEEKSTGMGRGVAIPHARTDASALVHVAFGLCRQGCAWGAADGKPVQFIFLVVGPKRVTEDYLRLLADFSRLTARANAREALLGARAAADVLRIVGQQRERGHRS